MVTPQPPPAGRRFRIDRQLDRHQLRHVTALSTGRTPGSLMQDDALRSASARPPRRYEIVSMESSAFVFDNETSRFADVSAKDWRHQLSAVPQPPTSPPTPAASGQRKTATRRHHRNLHGQRKTAKSVALGDDPLAALGKPDDTFRWSESLGGAALSKPTGRDQMLDGRLKLPEVPARVDSQRHGRLVRDGAAEAGAVIMYQPSSQAERNRWSKYGGKGWPKVARLKRFQVQPADDGKKPAGKATIELLLDGTVIDAVDMLSLTAEPQPRWAMREAVVAAAAALPPRYSGWNPEMQAQKQMAAFEAGYAEPVGMEMAKDEEAWKAEMAAREWEQAVFGMQEDDWERSCAEQWAETATVDKQKAAEEATRAAALQKEEERKLRAASQAVAKQAELDERRRLTHDFINWRPRYEDRKKLREEQAKAARQARERAEQAFAAQAAAEEEAMHREILQAERLQSRILMDLADATREVDQTENEVVAATAAGSNEAPQPVPEPEQEPESEPGSESESESQPKTDPELGLEQIEELNSCSYAEDDEQTRESARQVSELVGTVEEEEELTADAQELEPSQEQVSTVGSTPDEQEHGRPVDEQPGKHGSKATFEFEPVQVTPLLDSLTAMLSTEGHSEEIAEELSYAPAPALNQCKLVDPTGSAGVAEVAPELLVQQEDELSGPLDNAESPSAEKQPSEQNAPPVPAAAAATSELQPQRNSDGSATEFILGQLEGEEGSEMEPQPAATVTRKVRLGAQQHTQ